MLEDREMKHAWGTSSKRFDNRRLSFIVVADKVNDNRNSDLSNRCWVLVANVFFHSPHDEICAL